MLSSFNLKVPPKILFGAGRFSELPTLTSNYSNPLVVLGGSSFSNSDHFRQLCKMLNLNDKDQSIVNISQEPSPELIDAVIKQNQETKLDIVIGIGGGSVLDAAKAISAMLAENASILDYLEGVGTKSPSGKKLPFIAIPTTSGTGSEATSNAVISVVGENGFKKSLRHDNYIPDVALVDSQLTLSCPQTVTVACAMDCFSQLLEGYLSTNSSHVTDIIALDGIKAIKRSVKNVCEQGENLDARNDLSYAALLSGVVLANAGLGTVHGFASVIGGYFPVPHGVVCGSLMASANDHTLKALRREIKDPHNSMGKYSILGKLFSDTHGKSDTWYQDYFIDALYQLSEDLRIPKLSDYGIKISHISDIAEKTGNKNNPVALVMEERAQILQSRIA